MIKEIIICDRCGKETLKDRKLKYYVVSAPYCDDFGTIISKERPIDLCEDCDSDLDDFIRSSKAKEYKRPPKYPSLNPSRDFDYSIATSAYAAPTFGSLGAHSTSVTQQYTSKEGSDSDGNST